MADILLTIDESIVFNIFEETSTKVSWDKFKQQYEGKKVSNRKFLHRQLCNPRMKDLSSLPEHLNEFKTLVSRLIVDGVKIEEEKGFSVVLHNV